MVSCCGPANKPSDATVADLVDDDDLRGAVQAAIDDANKAVSHAEAIKSFKILPEDWSVETGHLTPSLNLVRITAGFSGARPVTLVIVEASVGRAPLRPVLGAASKEPNLLSLPDATD